MAEVSDGWTISVVSISPFFSRQARDLPGVENELLPTGKAPPPLVFINSQLYICDCYAGVTISILMLLIVAIITIIFLWLRIRAIGRKNLL